MSEYDHKKSTKIVGQLYPILLDKAGNTIDGVHRRQADPNWRTERHPEIDTEEKFFVARCVANWHRRQVSKEEKIEWINGLAKIYSEQGYKTRKTVKTDTGGYRINEIVNKIAEVTGLTEQTVRSYLSPAYKLMYEIITFSVSLTSLHVLVRFLNKKDINSLDSYTIGYLIIT